MNKPHRKRRSGRLVFGLAFSVCILAAVFYFMGAKEFGWQIRLNRGAAATNTYLSDLTPTYQTNGWGPMEKDKSNGETAAGDGTTITLNGKTFAKGLGAHAPSDLRYDLGGKCSAFTAEVGIDDEVKKGSVIFKVYADGIKLFDSGVMYYNSATKVVGVDVTSKKELKLVITDGGNGNGGDHGDWANASITCGSDAIDPVITAFDVQPRTTTGSVTVTFSATDAGGSYINRAELKTSSYDATTCNGPTRTGCVWSTPKTLNAPAGTNSWTSSMTHTPAAGTYLYGIKIIDNAGNNVHEPALIKVTSGSSSTPVPTTTPTPTPTPIGSTGSLKVLTWNTGGEPTSTDASSQISKIVSRKPQIVFLEEVDSSTHIKNIKDALQKDQGGTWDLYYALRGTDTSSSYVAIISKYNLTNGRELILRKPGTYPVACISSRLWAGRKALGANLTFNNRPISVFAVRTSSDTDVDCVRKEEVTNLKAWANDINNGFANVKIYGGDFNMQPGDSDYNAMVASPFSTLDSWKIAVDGGDAVAYSGTPSFTTPTRNTRMDYIFYNSTTYLGVVKAEIVGLTKLSNGQYDSDHRIMETIFTVR